jgi:hypothetical protein
MAQPTPALSSDVTLPRPALLRALDDDGALGV